MSIEATIERIGESADLVMDTREATHEDWLAARKTGIGGSDAAASIGLSPWASPFSLWAEKKAETVEDIDNRLMRWGRRLEEAIVNGFSEDTETPIVRYPFMLRSKKYPFMVVNLDAVAPESVVEAKNVGIYMAEEWEDGAVPQHYGIQGQHALAVTGLDRICFAALVGGNDPRYVEVERNEELIEKLIDGERKFWELVEANTPPAIDDGSDATLKALKVIYGNPDAETRIELPGEAVQVIAERAALKEMIKTDKARIVELETRLYAWLGNYEIGTINGTDVFSWKKITRTGYVVLPTSYRTPHEIKPKTKNKKAKR